MLVYDRVIELGEEEFPLPEPTPGKKGRPKKGAARSFIDRMKNHKELNFPTTKIKPIP